VDAWGSGLKAFVLVPFIMGWVRNVVWIHLLSVFPFVMGLEMCCGCVCCDSFYVHRSWCV